MERTAVPGRLSWCRAVVTSVIEETPRVRSLILACPGWTGHRPGQHVDVRLTAEDGYQAQRAYSIASAGEEPGLMLTVERLDDGEVSPYLVDEVRPGDELEVRGPIGGYFTWQVGEGAPLLLMAGGSGVVPFRAMLRHRSLAHSRVPVRLLYSVRSDDEVIYGPELTQLAAAEQVDVRITYTRRPPDGWTGHRGRIDMAMVAATAWDPVERAHVFICGPSGFVETASNLLVDLGHDPALIRTERFGPSGS